MNGLIFASFALNAIMNYLAHAYLSFQEPDIVVGNMISDFVKGKKKFEFSPAIQTGISLHREIDAFTDAHKTTQEAKEFFRPVYRLYAAAFTDVVYDHFLANDPHEFSTPQDLQQFSLSTYRTLSGYEAVLPVPFLLMFPHMQQHDWLYNYRLAEGMRRSFGGLVRRSQYLTDAEPAFYLFDKHYDALKQCYEAFFPSLKQFAWEKLQQLKQF